jgi:multimeric flavodoxin WrbA
MIYFEELVKKAKLIENPIQKVLAIGGSPRNGGNTDIIINQITSGLKAENIEFENVNLGKIDFKYCL